METEQVDRRKFPLFEMASLHIADLRPGDVFFCPSDWWHTTFVVRSRAVKPSTLNPKP
jgi:hypothetical protein